MSVSRMAVVFLALVVIGLGTVHLRARRVQHVHQIQQLRAEQTRLQQTLWAVQLEKARLSAPQRIRERVTSMNLVVVPPTQTTDQQPGGAAGQRSRKGAAGHVPRGVARSTTTGR